MKKNFIFAFFLFLIVEYTLRTFVKEYKYHEIGFLMELLPLAIASLTISFYSRKIIQTENFLSIYLKLSSTSIFGFLTAKIILYFQWYWIIAPEYRNVNGDMEEGLAWVLYESLVATVEIMILFLISVVIIKRIRNGK